MTLFEFYLKIQSMILQDQELCNKEIVSVDCNGLVHALRFEQGFIHGESYSDEEFLDVSSDLEVEEIQQGEKCLAIICDG